MAAGVVLRAVFVFGHWGTVDSDEAVVGLMARGFRDGHWRAFFWGQHYAGTQETALVAYAGASRLALKLVPCALSGVAALLTWRVGRRFLDERVAQLAGLLFWVAPGAYVWWSTKERGFYWVALVAGLVVVLAAQRIVQDGGRLADGAMFGVAAGTGLWASPAILYFAAPAGIWVVARRRPPLRWPAVAVPSAALGALPWWWHGIGHGWATLDRPAQPHHVSYAGGLGRLLWRTLPIALNLRYPISDRWVAGWIGPLVYVGAGAALAVVIVRRRTRPVVLLALLAAFPFIYAWFPGAWFVGEGRYALFVAPLLALAVAWMVHRPDVLAVLAAVSAIISFTVVRPIGSEQPRHLGPDISALRIYGVDHAWADYWLAYRLTFESDGAVAATPYQSSRDRALFDAARRDRSPAFVFRKGDRRVRELDGALTVPHQLVHTRSFDVVLVDGSVDPATLPAGVAP